MIDGQSEGAPGVTVVKKEQRLWGGNNGKGQVKGLLTRKLEAAKARQQATAARMKEQAKRQAEARTRLGIRPHGVHRCQRCLLRQSPRECTESEAVRDLLYHVPSWF